MRRLSGANSRRRLYDKIFCQRRRCKVWLPPERFFSITRISVGVRNDVRTSGGILLVQNPGMHVAIDIWKATFLALGVLPKPLYLKSPRCLRTSMSWREDFWSLGCSFDGGMTHASFERWDWLCRRILDETQENEILVAIMAGLLVWIVARTYSKALYEMRND